jgi:hypothetical protein
MRITERMLVVSTFRYPFSDSTTDRRSSNQRVVVVQTSMIDAVTVGGLVVEKTLIVKVREYLSLVLQFTKNKLYDWASPVLSLICCFDIP